MAIAQELVKDDTFEIKDGRYVCLICPVDQKTQEHPSFETKRGIGIHRAQLHGDVLASQNGASHPSANGSSLPKRKVARRSSKKTAARLAAVSIKFPAPASRIQIDSEGLLRAYDADGKLIAANLLDGLAK